MTRIVESDDRDSQEQMILVWAGETKGFCLWVCPVSYPSLYLYHPVLSSCPILSCSILYLLSVAVSSCSAEGQVSTSCNLSNNSWILLQACICSFPGKYQEVSFNMACAAAHTVHLHGLCLPRSHQSFPYYAFTHFTPSCDMVTACIHWGKIQRNPPMPQRRCLPGFSRCMKLGCSRSPPSCSGTPATSVCCSSPGLRSFLRPRSAASWAPRIGRRTETGTYFYLHFNTPKWAETERAPASEDWASPSGGYLLCWRWFKEATKAWPRRIATVYLQCSSRIIWPVTGASKRRKGRCYSVNTPPRPFNQRQSPDIWRLRKI